MSPEEQQSYLLRQQEQSKTARYWRRHAPTTFVALVACVLASVFVKPMHWSSAIALATAGVVLYAGWAADCKGHAVAGGLLMAGAAIAVAGTVWLFELRGPIMWVQGFGVWFAAFCGSLVLHQAMHEERDGDV